MKALAIRKMDWPPIRLFTWLPPLMKLLSQRLQTLTILNHCESRVQAQIVKHELIAEKKKGHNAASHKRGRHSGNFCVCEHVHLSQI